MKSACFTGCSLTVGEGFAPDQRDQFIYDRLVAERCGFQRTNLAKGGNSNHEIFLTAARAIPQEFDIIFVQWSALNRIWLYPGPDCEWFTNDGQPEFRYRELFLDHKSKSLFQEQLLMMNHDYHNIFFLVDYCHILEKLAKYHGKNLVFINGLVPWCDDLINPVGKDLASSLSDYSKSILDFDHRDDAEIIQLFSKLHQKMITVDLSKWVNIWQSFQKLTVDVGPLGHHPGMKSHAIMADLIVQHLVRSKICEVDQKYQKC